MSLVRRIVLVAAIAALAVVPLRAFGVVGGDPSGLAVSASLGGCSVAGNGIVCEIQASFGGVEDADYYTASVTRADGSVQDVGQVGSSEGGGSASILVPYVGAGNYSVTVTAYGTPGDDDEKPEVLERDRADADREARHEGEVTAEPADEETTDPAADDAQGDDAPADPGATNVTPVEPAPEPPPECTAEAEVPAEAPVEGETEPEAPPPPAGASPCSSQGYSPAG